MTVESGPQGHVRAIYDGLAERGHRLRLVAMQTEDTLAEIDGRKIGNGAVPRPGGESDSLRPRRPFWSDDLRAWHRLKYGPSRSPWFRAFERPVRWAQSRFNLPYARFFDSYRFGDGCATALAGFDVLYERQGMLSYGGLFAARRLGVPLVYEVNGDSLEEHRLLGIELPAAQWSIFHHVTGQMYRRADHVVAVGAAIRSILIDRWRLDPTRVSVITNGVDVARFATAFDLDTVRREHDIPWAQVVMFVGSFQPWHGVEQIVKAFALVAEQSPQVGLVLVGDGELREALTQRVAELGLRDRVRFTGQATRAQIPALLALADIAVLYQPRAAGEIVETPLKLFEYMAAGKAIVAPDFPNMRSVLGDDVSGVLVEPDAPAALAGALQRLLDEDETRRRLGAAARDEAVAKHSWHRAVREVEELLYHMVDERAGRRGARS
jgi:glycosyltransferase involved in cell wall biosynthesis